jgi:protein CpxP
MTRRTIALAALIAAFGVNTSRTVIGADDKAETKKPNAERPERPNRANAEERLNNFAKEANLSDDQKTKLKDILEKEQAKMRELRQDTSASREDRRSKTQDLRKETDAKVKALLNADQYAKWEKMREQGAGGRRRQQAQ